MSSEDVSSEDAASKRWARLRGLGDAPQSSSDDVSSDEGAEGPAALAPPSSSEVGTECLLLCGRPGARGHSRTACT